VKNDLKSTLLGVIVISGCATSGHNFDAQGASQLKPGVSTINDATTLLGPYNTEATNGRTGNHAYGWTYARTNGFVGKTESKAVILVFDASGHYLSKSSASHNSSF
jgi:hypothetical protein